MSAASRVGVGALTPEPLLENNPSLHDVTEAICAPVELDVAKTPIGWLIGFVCALGMLGVFLGAVGV